MVLSPPKEKASLSRPQLIYVVEVKEIIDLVPKAILK